MMRGRKIMNVALWAAIAAAFLCGLGCILQRPKK